MSLSQLLNSISTDSSDLPSEVVKSVRSTADYAVGRHPSVPTGPEAFGDFEKFSRDVGAALSRQLVKEFLETQNQHYSERIERDGRTWQRADPTPKTTAAATGSVECERRRNRTGGLGASPVPVDESLGPVERRPARRANCLSVPAKSHCPPRDAHAFFRGQGALAPSASTLQRVARSMHAEWDATAPEDRRMIRSGADIPGEAACGAVSFRDGEGSRMKTLYFGRMPESGGTALKWHLETAVAQVRERRPDIRVARAVASGAVSDSSRSPGPARRPPSPPGFLRCLGRSHAGLPACRGKPTRSAAFREAPHL